MATFRVGQRVRLVARKGFKIPKTRPHEPVGTIPLGTEGTICETAPIKPFRNSTVKAEYVIIFDGDRGRLRGVFAYQIEPLQPDSNKVVEWSECLWQPEHMWEVVLK